MCEPVNHCTRRGPGPTGVGVNYSEASQCNPIERGATDLWRYSWHGQDQVVITFSTGMRFEFLRLNDQFTSHNVIVAIDYLAGLARIERENDIRGNHALRWLADLWSDGPPDRTHYFAQIDRAVSRAYQAAATRNLGGVILAMQHGLASLNSARTAWGQYFSAHVDHAENNVTIVRWTRDISLTVSTTVLTGGSSTAVQLGVGVAVSGGTTLVEEVGVTRFGQDADIDWERIGLDTALGLLSKLGSLGLGKLAGAVFKKLGRFAASSGRGTQLLTALDSRFPSIGPELRSAVLSGRDLNVAQLRLDRTALLTVVSTAVRNFLRDAPQQLLISAARTAMENSYAGARGRPEIDEQQFWDKFVDHLTTGRAADLIISAIVGAIAA